MAAEYILSLADPRATLALAGGKGASLARLSQAGLPVPDGFHVTTAAYLDFVAENRLQERTLALASEAALALDDPAHYAALEAASRAIQDLFQQAAMPVAIEAAIVLAYTGLPGEVPRVAVRSSATAEDLPGLSFAGQQETYLNVHGIHPLLESVKSCWASLWTARAISYRAQHGIRSEELSLAVVVQKLVRAGASGVMFTANPANGRRDQVMITTAWGLGEAIVGGLVTPDTLTVNKASGQVIERQTARKEVETVLLESGIGTREQPLPEDLRSKAVLSDQEAAALAGLGVRIEALYGGTPMDIEWTLADGEFAIVQARPITALPPNSGDEPEEQVEPPTEWKRPDPHGIYGRGSITEQLPEPLTPLFSSLGGPIIDQETRRIYAEYMGVKEWKGPIFDTINDYAYLNMNFSQWTMFRMVLSSLLIARKMLSDAEPRYRAARQHYIEVVQRYQARPLSDYRAAGLLEGARQLTRQAISLYTVLQTSVIPGASTSEIMFTQTYNHLIKKAGDPQASVFLIGFVSTPIHAEQALYDLVGWAKAQAGLATHLAAEPAAKLAAELNHAAALPTPVGVEPEAWSEWRRRFAEHLAAYGHSTYDMDFSRAVAADDPAPLLETCRMYLLGKAGSPYDRLQALAGRREQATQTMLKRLRGLKRWIFLKQLRSAQRNAPLREDGFSDLGLGYPQLRRMLRELGSRLVRAGMFAQPDDVFWLKAEELEQAAAALDQGQPVEAMLETIRQRKAVWRAEQRLVAPLVLPPGSKLFGFDYEKLSAARASDDVNVIKGFGASQGKVTATARVLLGPQDFSQMQPGDVLVSPITTPAWTPLFAMASAIVTDIGGPLSHSSIVAREYGLPAVLGTGVATRRIRSGQRITVDGDAGSVTLEADLESGAALPQFTHFGAGRQ
jgi:pyruvate,water dikinase